MINRVTGEVSFQSGLYITPQRPILLPHKTQVLSLKNWKRHILGHHPSAHGTFEVEALSSGQDRIQLVLLSHQHSFYERDTPSDADRRIFHEGVISKDLAGQREFSWGEALCRLEVRCNKDWLVIAYNLGADIPLKDRKIFLQLLAHEKTPGKDI